MTTTINKDILTVEKYPKQYSGNRFEYRSFNGEYQVYAAELEHICLCSTKEKAELVTQALNNL
jgi:hypothetical protein